MQAADYTATAAAAATAATAAAAAAFTVVCYVGMICSHSKTTSIRAAQ
jgi:hypothetical protein